MSATLAPSPAAAHDTLDAEMLQVDAVVRQRLKSDVALIDQISHYIIGAGGKRIRPRLVLMFAAALGYTGHDRFELAAIIEFIHKIGRAHV